MAAKPLQLILIACFMLLSIFLKGIYAQKIRYTVSRTSSTARAVSISNPGQVSVDAGIVLGDFIFLNEKALIDSIRSMKVPQGLEADYRKAWYFMLSRTWSARKPLAGREHFNDLNVFINSAGFGFCGAKSDALAGIWSLMGYPSRVVDIGGHVVPEIYVGQRWEVWDPTYHACYVDSSGRICSVEELSARPWLVDHPVRLSYIPYYYWNRMMAFSRNTAELYSSSENNQVVRDFQAVDPKGNTAEILLPASCSMVFPVYSGLPLYSVYRGVTTKLTDYAELAVFVPAGVSTRLSIPLLFHAATSAGSTLKLGNLTVELTKSKSEYVSSGYSLFQTIEIAGNSEGCTLFFLLNPRLFDDMAKRNQKVWETEEPLQIRWVNPHFSNRVNVIYLDDLKGGLKFRKFVKEMGRVLLR